jgi:hypothetical protein
VFHRARLAARLAVHDSDASQLMASGQVRPRPAQRLLKRLTTTHDTAIQSGRQVSRARGTGDLLRLLARRLVQPELCAVSIVGRQRGRRIGAAPPGLPEGEVDLALADTDDDLSEAELARLNETLERGFEAIKGGLPGAARSTRAKRTVRQEPACMVAHVTKITASIRRATSSSSRPTIQVDVR